MRISACLLSSVICLFALLTSRVVAQQVTPAPDQQAPATPVTQWPQRIDSPDGLITVYEPQPNKFEGDTLAARAAVSLTPPGSTDPEFGAMWFTARVSTDRDSRVVTVQNVTIKQVKLPNFSPDQEKKFGQVIEQQVPGMNLMLSLDQLESTVSLVQKAHEEAQQLDNNPPNIVFVDTPTTLVILDGDPKLQPTQDAGVMAVVNTPFIMLFDGNSKRYFLKAGEFWMIASDVLGQWTPAGNDIPAGVTDAGSKLTDNSAPQVAQQPGPPQIRVAEQPTELIASQGPPTYTPLPNNNLLYMSNTQSDVFLEVASQQYYILLSGRWFESKSLQGPWSFVVSDKLPGAFAQIPADSPKANVLASVAGTQQAKNARMDAFIPQTTAISRNAGANLAVTYDGTPQFAPIQNSPITYASNCPYPVLDVNGTYYCCEQAVWYQSANATGPWTVCTAVPQAIYTLPPSCPVYNCRYCYVYDSTPDTVYCGYLPGYTGCYVYDGTVVYGTGYNYPFWYHTLFIPHPYTWGFGAAYDFYAGTWGFGNAFGYDSGWFVDRPERRDWFGPQGYVDYRENHNRVNRVSDNRTAVRNVTVNRINLYNRQENIHRNAEILNARTVTDQHVTNEIHNQSARRDLPAVENNVYVGQDGGIYRRTQTGWETRDSKGWTALKSLPDTRVERAGNDHEPSLVQHADQKVQESHQPADSAFHQEPIQQAPIHENPIRQTPVEQSPGRQPERSAAPEREEQPGLEEERVARERTSFSAPQEHNAPEESHVGGGGGGERGGGGRGR